MRLFLTRAAFVILISLVICLILRKTKLRRRWLGILVCASIMLTAGFALTPIEKAILTFSSPEESYQYNNAGDVLAVVTGVESAFVIGRHGDTDTNVIVPKSGQAWKLGTAIDMRCVYHNATDGVVLSIYQYKNTRDFYLSVFDTNGGAAVVSDNRASQFKAVEKANKVLAKKFYTYYAYLNTYDTAYELTVNNKTMHIHE